MFLLMKGLGESVAWNGGRYFMESAKVLDASPSLSLKISSPNQVAISLQVKDVVCWLAKAASNSLVNCSRKRRPSSTRSPFFISTSTSPIHHVRATSKALPNERDLALHRFVYKTNPRHKQKPPSSTNHTTTIRPYTKLWTTLAEGPTALVR